MTTPIRPGPSATDTRPTKYRVPYTTVAEAFEIDVADVPELLHRAELRPSDSKVLSETDFAILQAVVERHQRSRIGLYAWLREHRKRTADHEGKPDQVIPAFPSLNVVRNMSDVNAPRQEQLWRKVWSFADEKGVDGLGVAAALRRLGLAYPASTLNENHLVAIWRLLHEVTTELVTRGDNTGAWSREDAPEIALGESADVASPLTPEGVARGGERVAVPAPEEHQEPAFAGLRYEPSADGGNESGESPSMAASQDPGTTETDSGAGALAADAGPQPGLVVVPANATGWSFRRLFADYLRGASRIEVRDPYIRFFYQIRNLMEFLSMVHDLVPEGDEVAVHLVTQNDAKTATKQEEFLNEVASSFTGYRVAFTWEIEADFHARSITTDHGWTITLDRGLDFFRKFQGGPFSAAQSVQEARLTKGASVGYFRV